MRNKKRIPIVLDLMRNTSALERFLNTKDKDIFLNIHSCLTEIEKEWIKCPDLRFGQLLSNLGLVSRAIEDCIWNIEEDQWLIDNGYLNIEDIKFWGVNYTKQNKIRKKPIFKLLKNLELDHIKNILIFFGKNLNRMNTKYLEYFNKRINEKNSN